jgi:hypothetical protein
MSPLLFENMPAKEQFSIPLKRRNAKFTALRTTLGFDTVERDLATTDVRHFFTTPPSPVILNEGLGEAFAYSSSDWRGCWLRFFLLTYFYEGQIWFRKVDEWTFAVQVRFNDDLQTVFEPQRGQS